MSLPRGERKALRQIEASLDRSDPELARLLGGFGEQAGAPGVPGDERSPRGVARLRAAFVGVQGTPPRWRLRLHAQPSVHAPWSGYSGW